MMKTKIFHDPVHGYVQINENDLKFIDTLTFQRLRRIRQSGCHTVPWKNQFQLKEIFSQADAQLGQFINTDPSNIESDLKETLQLDEDKIFAVMAEYKFKNPKVYLNLSGITKDFASIFHNDIYFALLDSVPMVYVHPEVDLETVRKAVKQLYI